MEAEVYPEPRVTQFINDTFIPVRLHVKTHPEAMDRFEVQWTPTVLILDPNGKERHRVEGFLPTDDFLAQIELGAGHAAFAAKRYEEAEKRFRTIVEQFPKTEAGPEALYWAGVASYRATGEASALGATAKAFKDRYAGTSWAKKASIWGSAE